MNAEIQAILSRYDLPNSVLLGDLSGHLTGDELSRVHYLLKYPNEKTEPKGGRMTMSNKHFDHWISDEGEKDSKLSLTSDAFLKLTVELEELFQSFGLSRWEAEKEFAFIREDLMDCFNKQANTEEDSDD